MKIFHLNSPKRKTTEIHPKTLLRRSFLLKHIKLSRKGLEIGPYDYPTIFKSEADISYLDWKTRAQLIAECHSQDEIGSIPEIDYIVASNNYMQYVPDKFDYIIANHVLEHIPNLIQWLSNITEMLNPEGVLFLALPDKEFTFDKYRPNTTLSHLLIDYYEFVENISKEHMLEQELFYDLEFINKPMVISERLNRARLEAVFSQEIHIGYHCHIFQSKTVLDTIFKPLIMMGYLNLDILEFVSARETNYGEMILIFKKTVPSPINSTVDLKRFYISDF